jgi:hypothetical protein
VPTENDILTTQNFFEVWDSFQPAPPQPVFYRLYYNSQGCPVSYTMEDLPGDFIEIDRETYVVGPANVRVLNGQLITLKPSVIIKKLTPGGVGTSCDPRDICVVVDQQLPHVKWNMKTNEHS